MRRVTRGLLALGIIYFLLTLVVSAALPLRLSELHQALVSLNFSWLRFLRGMAAIPGAVPLGFIVQLPFALLAHHSRILLRLPSMLAAIANCYLFWQLARRTPVRAPLAAAIVFLFVPIQFLAACDSRPYEVALLFLLLATSQLAKMIEAPDYRTLAIYGGLLTLCIYTEPASYVPAIGYVLFLLRFANKPAERNALWYILPATVLPGFLYLPYYAWANPQRNLKLLTVKQPFSDSDMWLQALHSLAPGNQFTLAGVVLFLLLLIGLGVGIASSFPPLVWPRKMQINLFCLAGGSIVSLLYAIATASGYGTPLVPEQVLFALPGLVILSFAALDWVVKTRPALKTLSYPAAAALLCLLCIPAIVDFATSPAPDIERVVQIANQNLGPGSCVVFVSEGESPYFFLLFDPNIWQHECHNFFSKRIVMVSHPWVRPDQQRDAELFFRGLNFVETKRYHVSEGLVIIDETK